MTLTEQHIITKKNSNWKQIDNLCFLSKNLYNSWLYTVKQQYLKTTKFLRYKDIERLFREVQQPDYFYISTASSQQIIILADRNLKSYFSLLRKWKKDRKTLTGCPKFPKYKDKTKGRNIFIFRNDQIRRFEDNYLLFPKKTNLKPIKTKLIDQKISQVRLIPKSSHYVIEIVYEVQEKQLKKDNKNYSSIDLGLNNLATLTTNLENKVPLIINGKSLKSINQYYNKRKSYIQSELELRHHRKTSNKLSNLTLKRNNKIKDYLHKASRFIVNYLVKEDISKLVVGLNKEWKQNINLGKRNNQAFVDIPHETFISMLKYKCELEGIEFKVREESYTSKCSALDLEEVRKQETYKGKRIKRGLFRTEKGILVNADVNGSLNIGRKEFGDVFMRPANRGFVINPVKVEL